MTAPTSVTYVAATNVRINSGAAGSFTTPTVPAGTMLMAVISGRQVTAVTGPSGGATWSQQYAPDGSLSIWTAIATAADSNSVHSFTATSSNPVAGVTCAGYSGASATLEAVGLGTTQQSTTTRNFPSLTVSSAVRQLVGFVSHFDINNVSFTLNGLTTRRSGSGVSFSAYAVGDAGGYTTPGATPSSAYSNTCSVENEGRNSILVALRLDAQPPNAPTLNSPANNAILDRSIVQRFAWTFSDPNPGDSQSQFDIRFSSDNGSTWTTYTSATPNNFYDAPANQLAAGSWQWQVRTYDSQGAVGQWSASSFFTAATPVAAPTITAPASGATIGTSSYSVTWSAPNQGSYQVQRAADNAGSINTGTIYYDTGEIVTSTDRAVTVPFETNSRYEWVRVRVKGTNGLWSPWAQNRVLVSYTPPPAPNTPTFTVQQALGAIDVAWSTPAATGSQPTPTSVNIYRSRDGGVTSERVAVAQPVNGTWRFWTPASGVVYSFQIQSVADNGLTNSTGWTS